METEARNMSPLVLSEIPKKLVRPTPRTRKAVRPGRMVKRAWKAYGTEGFSLRAFAKGLRLHSSPFSPELRNAAIAWLDGKAK